MAKMLARPVIAMDSPVSAWLRFAEIGMGSTGDFTADFRLR